MFKPADDLRLAAQMRALQRVAAPWRQARTRWFDGSPESLEARLAATDGVLVHARSGLTAAHLELAGEAEAARLELLAGRHRLLTDFLDDGARAFRGSKRTANEDEFIDCPYCGAESDAAEFRDGVCPVCGKANYETHPFYARRTAGEGMSWEDSQDYISDALSRGEHGMAARPTTPERPAWNRHSHPIHQGQEVYWADETTGEVTEPHPLAGRIVEHPAVDPDGNVHHDMATVEWPDSGYELHHIDELVPKDRHHGTWDPDTEQDPFDPRLIGASRTASSGGLDWKYEGFGEDDGQSGHEATTELGDLIQTSVERPTIPNPNGRGGTIDFKSPPLGWGYGIWTYEPFDVDGEPGNHRDNGWGDGDHVWQGNNGKTIYKTHDEAKAAAEKHYYSLDHAGRSRDGGVRDSGVDYSDLNKFMGGGDGPDDDFGHIFGSRRTASGQLDDLTQRKALNLVRQWMHNRYGDEDSKDPMVPSGQKAYESGAGLKLHPSWVPSWQHPITGQMNDEPPVPAILHEGITGWADDASFDDDLAEQLRQVGVEAGNWNGSIMTLHPHQGWDLKDALQKALPAEHGLPPATASRRAAAVLPDFPDELMF